ncbi:hypothetical protein Tco_1288375, partial [Tanacetum coccineum]
MRTLLIQHECKAALKVLPLDMEAEAKAKLNKKAHSVIILCLGNKVLREVTAETTTTEVWTKLETLYMIKSLANKLYLKKKFLICLLGFRLIFSTSATKKFFKVFNTYKVLPLAGVEKDHTQRCFVKVIQSLLYLIVDGGLSSSSFVRTSIHHFPSFPQVQITGLKALNDFIIVIIHESFTLFIDVGKLLKRFLLRGLKQGTNVVVVTKGMTVVVSGMVVVLVMVSSWENFGGVSKLNKLHPTDPPKPKTDPGFNTIITSLKALDEDLSSLALDEFIGNLKVHEVVMEKDSKIYKGKKERAKYIALKAKKESSNDETSTFERDEEEYAMAVRNFKKFFRRKDAVIRIISLAIVQSLHKTKIKRRLLEVVGAIAKMKL